MFWFVLPCLVLFCLVLSCFVLPCLVLSCFVLFCLVLSCFVLFCFVLSCFVSFFTVLYCIVLYCILFYSIYFNLFVFVYKLLAQWVMSTFIRKGWKFSCWTSTLNLLIISKNELNLKNLEGACSNPVNPFFKI